MASVGGLSIQCDEGSSVNSQISFTVSATRGPAATSDVLPLQYFVAVVKDNHQIITKEIYDVTLQFNREGGASSREVVSLSIPTIEQARRYNYEFVVGFQMTPEQAAYNLTR